MFVEEVFAANGGLATTQQLLSGMSRKTLGGHLKASPAASDWCIATTSRMPPALAAIGTPTSAPGRSIRSCCWRVTAAGAPVIRETADEGCKDGIAFLREHVGG
jgi:hypothetical protein